MQSNNRPRRPMALFIIFSLTLIGLATLSDRVTQPAFGQTGPLARRPIAGQTVAALPAYSPSTSVTPGSLGAALNCRYGVSAPSSTRPWLPVIGAGWHVNFTQTGNFFDGSEFVRFVHTYQNKDGQGNYLPGYTLSRDGSFNQNTLRGTVNAAPGSLWFIGNEIERIGQDEIFPETYAQAYHEIYHLIKEEDPTASVGIAPLVQITPNRLDYLEKVWDAYAHSYNQAMPVDVWNAHIYILPEVLPSGAPNGIASVAMGTTDFSQVIYESDNNAANCGNPNDNIYCWAEHDNMQIFAKQVTTMRQWMKDHGQQNKPLVISEFGILYPNEWEPGNPGAGCFQDEFGNCFTPARTNSFMHNAFTYMETTSSPSLGFPADNNRLVQQWLWFSLYSSYVGRASNLLLDNYYTGFTPGDPAALSPMGQTYRAEVATRGTPMPNLYLEKAVGAVGFMPVPGSVTVDLVAKIRNSGNARSVQPVTVTFYRDAALTQPIASAPLGPLTVGCSAFQYEARVSWTLTTPGRYRYWVKVDTGNVLAESNENDNVQQGVVLVNPYQTFVPILPVNR